MMVDTHPTAEIKDMKAGLEVLLLKVQPDLDDEELDSYVKQVLEITHAKK